MVDQAFPTAPHSSTLTLRDLCAGLVASEEIAQEDADRVLSANLGATNNADHPASRRHPLEMIAKAGLQSLQTERTLDLDTLSQWLAKWARQPCNHIDPLRIDTLAIAQVMSYAFSQRHGILAVEIGRDEVLIPVQSLLKATGKPTSNRR
jgi:general secretion pathway protein E